MMRRSAFAAVVSLAVLIPTTPAAGDTFLAAGASQGAFAIWLRLGKSEGTMYVLDAFRGGYALFDGDPYWDADASVAVGKGPCKIKRGKNFVLVSCSARMRTKDVSPLVVDIDPLLSKASVVVRIAGKTHRATWTGLGPAPIPGAGFEGPPYVGGGAAAVRPAKVSGRVMGKTLRFKRAWDMGFLGEGGGAAAYDDAFDVNGDVVQFQERFETGR